MCGCECVCSCQEQDIKAVFEANVFVMSHPKMYHCSEAGNCRELLLLKACWEAWRMCLPAATMHFLLIQHTPTISNIKPSSPHLLRLDKSTSCKCDVQH